jgi:site-specific DNA-methyltransferase (adenine-specific)
MLSVWRMDAPRHEEKVFGKHPTQKPLALLERIIAAATDENDLVLDPFSGSATTGIAAARMNRRYVGIELDSPFLEVSVKRYEQESVHLAHSPFLDFCRGQHGASVKSSSKEKDPALFE